MAQHDYVLANAAGAAFRADINNALAAIVSQNSGPNQPNPTYAYQLWADTTAGQLKFRNAANNAWIVWGSLADVGLGLLSRAGGTMTGALLQLAGTAAAPGLAIAGDADTGLYGKAADELGIAVAGALAAWFSADGLNLPAQDDVRFWDSDSSHYVGFQAPATVTTNRVWTLPATDGTTGQGLTTNGSNVLGWADVGIPAGTVQFYAANSAPAGWVKANGAAVSRATYADLFAAIGTTFGVGNGSTTFNVPDLRGEFPRGWDDGRGIDSGRAFGSAQADGFRTHSHAITGYSAGVNNVGGAHFYNTNQFNTTASTSTTSTPAGDAETRPRNIALLAIIKF